jgi:hypothetical protein
MICGADGFSDIAVFGESKKKWFSEVLDLPYDIPSHGTIGRFFSILKPTEFSNFISSWTQN